MQAWYQQLPARLLQELEAVAEANLRLRFERLPAGLLGWRGTVRVDDEDHVLQIVYTPDFPVRPPWVRETIGLTDDLVDDWATHHQFSDGSLCLFAMGTGPDAWRPDLTVVDVVGRYVEFRRIANQRGHVNEHGLPLSTEPGVPLSKVLILTPGQHEVLRMPTSWGWIHFFPMANGSAFVAGRVETSDRGLFVEQDLVPWARQLQPIPRPLLLPWISVQCARWRDLLPDLASVDAIIAERLPPGVGAREHPAGCVLFVAEDDSKTRLLLLERWHAPAASQRVLLRHEVEIVNLCDQLFQRVDGAMPGRESLRRWRVVMVGLGSLGGSIALHLARAGVSRFALFDPDRLQPENVVRHVAGLASLYSYKVEAVASHILDRNPLAEAMIFPSSPLWDGSPQATGHFETLLRDPDTLLVVSTADDKVERAINQLALLHRRPVLFASVVGHGEYGRVQRVLPGQTPCYQCVPIQQSRQPGRFFRASDAAPPRDPPAQGYHQPGIPGVGLDVEAVAVLAARLALQTLSRLGDGQPEYPDAPGHHLVWSSRGGEGFDHALQLRWEPYERDPACPACAGPEAGALSDTDRQRLGELERALSVPERLSPAHSAIISRAI